MQQNNINVETVGFDHVRSIEGDVFGVPKEILSDFGLPPKSIDNLKNVSIMKNCYVWLYRGAWKEWKIYDIDMSVPLTNEQAITKRKSIFKHQTQKDSPVFPGSDMREFWQRAEDRNADTAEKYNKLGLAEYAAIEAFKRYFF